MNVLFCRVEIKYKKKPFYKRSLQYSDLETLNCLAGHPNTTHCPHCRIKRKKKKSGELTSAAVYS